MSPRIQAILDNALEEVRAALLEEASSAVRAALEGGSEVGNGRRSPAAKAAPSKPSRMNPIPKRPKGAKRTADELSREVNLVFGAIQRARTGIRSEQLSEQLRIATKDLALPLQRLVEQKRVKTKGVRRGMQYLPR